MIDFSKKIGVKPKAKQVDPIEIYNGLDRKTDAGPLRPVQERVLKDWYDNRSKDRNLIVKLHTGEGKTLIGLLMLQSLLNEHGEPCLYLCPNEYLVGQTCREADKFGINVCQFSDMERSVIPVDFLNGKKILVTTVQKLFNGKTVFGLNANFTRIGSVVLDDSHACIESIKSSFSIRIKSDNNLYDKLLDLFYDDLKEQGAGTLLDIEKGSSDLLQIPYWSWFKKLHEVTGLLGAQTDDKAVLFAWPLLKDNLEDCLMFITGKGIEISPIFCPIEKFGSFANASHRILMSATTQDDSFFIKGFGFKEKDVVHPLTDNIQKWSGEKMILFPSLIDEKLSRLSMIKFFSNTKIPVPRFAIVPSSYLAQDYDRFGGVVTNRTNINSVIENIRKGDKSELNVLVNRYDGVNLPDNDCRILMIDSLPICDNLSDRYEMDCREGSEVTILKQVQKIEQGLGRSVRGEKDYSVIIIIGSDLVNFMINHHTACYFSAQTRKQIAIANDLVDSLKQEILESEDSRKNLVELINQSLNRDVNWKTYYQQEMDNISEVDGNNHVYSIMLKEREYEYAAYNRNYEKACQIVSDVINMCKGNLQEQAWYKQILARYKYFISELDSIHIQKTAFEKNPRLLYPQHGIDYKKMEFKSAGQLSNIQRWLQKFKNYREMRLKSREVFDNLSFGRTSTLFEEALKEIGEMLGFESQRPDNEYKVGPDNLWCGVHNQYIFFECKNEVKDDRNTIKKSEAGQMCNHCAWFEEKYGKANVCRIFVAPTNTLNHRANLTHDVKVMTPALLDKFKSSIDKFLMEFKDYDLNDVDDNLIQEALSAHHLTVDDIKKDYLIGVVKESNSK